ncbi:cysteine-rich venom protein VAR10-like [Paramacrobiotus metropolitanus]|uniref:cysteine-rich venom protein VAR10-like n=1 Tax=Paramacrobiotus metropolitanus TaxID=2943436 RepID=UPI0024461301|nr:cysteine-rich venom protein VAR10-like [Paramacrobiotus metropolitanus]
MCPILKLKLYALMINVAIWQAAGFGARSFGSSSPSSSSEVTSSEQSLLAFIYRCMGATSNAALGCPCAGNGKRCKNFLSICQNFKCICDPSISNTVNGQCVAIASLTNTDTTPTTITTSTTSVTSTTTTAAFAAGCSNKSDTALSTSAATKCTASTVTEIAYVPLTTPVPAGTTILEILNVHNNYRRSVAAQGMNKLDWSDCAASNAQHWADTCPSDHDRLSDRHIPEFPYCGQNIFWNSGSPATWTAAIKEWYNEVNIFSYCADNTGKDVGHYTQVMWADTTLIGCGMKSGCSTINGLNLPAPVNVFVCNYCTGGNVHTDGVANSEWCPYKTATTPGAATSNQCGASCMKGSACDQGDCLCATT